MSASNTTKTNTKEWVDFTEWQGRMVAGVECGDPVACLVWTKCTSDQGYGCMNVKWYDPATKLCKKEHPSPCNGAISAPYNSQPITMSRISPTTSFVAQWSTCPCLSLEPNWVNALHIKCIAEGTCPGQGRYRRCVFPD